MVILRCSHEVEQRCVSATMRTRLVEARVEGSSSALVLVLVLVRPGKMRVVVGGRALGAQVSR